MSDRITNRKKPGVAFWATVVVVVVLLYVTSFGPARWILPHTDLPEWTCETICALYRPVIWIEKHGPAPIRNAVSWYAMLWEPDYMGYQLQ